MVAFFCFDVNASQRLAAFCFRKRQLDVAVSVHTRYESTYRSGLSPPPRRNAEKWLTTLGVVRITVRQYRLSLSFAVIPTYK